MAINPFPRISPLDIPTYLPSAARAPEGTFSNIASLGDAIGQYRERNAIGELLKGAVDPQTGALDMNKAATAIALSGRDPTKYLSLLEAEARRKEAGSYRQEALDLARQGRDLQQKALDRPDIHYIPPDPLTGGGGVVTTPRTGGGVGVPTFQPYPTLAPTSPGPQSALEDPAIAPPPPNVAQAPEEAPPYQVAGPPTPPPQQAAPPTEAPPAPVPPARNEAILRNFPPAGQEYFKGLAEYKLDPAKATPQHLAIVKQYRPDWDQTEFQKRASPPSSETQGRMGLARGFLELIPAIKERMRAGELDFGAGTLNTILRRGRQGELVNAIDEGADALLRGLTGAGMPETEAARYQRRYMWSLTDDRQTRIQKLDGLERALRYVTTEQGKGRGGDDFLKGFESQFGKLELDREPAAVSRAKNDAEINRLVGKAKAAIARDPKGYDEAIKILQQRLPEGVDVRRLLER